MASEALHYRRLVITPSQQEKLMLECRKKAFNIATKSGFFLQTPELQGEFPVRLVHSKLVKTKALVIDEQRDDHLEFEKREWQVSSATDAVFDFNNGTVYVKGPKSGFEHIVKALEEMDVNLSTELVDLDIKVVFDAFRKVYPKTMVKSVGLKNYTADNEMKTSGTFKATKDSDTLEFITDNAALMNKWQVQGEHAGEKFKVTVTDKGSVSLSGEIPEGIPQLLGEMFIKHNLAAASEVEEKGEAEEESKPTLTLVPATPPPPPAPVPRAATV